MNIKPIDYHSPLKTRQTKSALQGPYSYITKVFASVVEARVNPGRYLRAEPSSPQIQPRLSPREMASGRGDHLESLNHPTQGALATDLS